MEQAWREWFSTELGGPARPTWNNVLGGCVHQRDPGPPKTNTLQRCLLGLSTTHRTSVCGPAPCRPGGCMRKFHCVARPTSSGSGCLTTDSGA